MPQNNSDKKYLTDNTGRANCLTFTSYNIKKIVSILDPYGYTSIGTFDLVFLHQGYLQNLTKTTIAIIIVTDSQLLVQLIIKGTTTT